MKSIDKFGEWYDNLNRNQRRVVGAAVACVIFTGCWEGLSACGEQSPNVLRTSITSIDPPAHEYAPSVVIDLK